MLVGRVGSEFSSGDDECALMGLLSLLNSKDQVDVLSFVTISAPMTNLTPEGIS
jgi:hypothetical protein